jgi:uncharacterized protein YbcI
MSGFEFRYRLGGGRPTVRSFACNNAERLTRGDIVGLQDGLIALPSAGGGSLLGAALDQPYGSEPETRISVIVDADAVYGFVDRQARKEGDGLVVAGRAGAQAVEKSADSALTVVADSAGDDETLVRISPGRHRALGPDDFHRLLTGGELNAALARAIVRFYHDEMGRGPAQARAFYRDDVVVVMLEDTLTKPEQALKARGRGDAVLDLREVIQRAIREEIVAIVEGLTGRTVRAFLSANNLDPDLLCECFVLDRRLTGGVEDGATLTVE